MSRNMFESLGSLQIGVAVKYGYADKSVRPSIEEDSV